MDIQRWNIMGFRAILPGPYGDWVRFPDHERVVRALQEEIERLSRPVIVITARTPPLVGHPAIPPQR